MNDFAAHDPAASMDARLVGQTLGDSYRVLRRIGAGGMGQVYEAEHTLLGRHFALKVLDTEQLTRRDAVSRFFAEARAASQIEHPHIVDVVHFLTDGPFMVLVMELLRGESLADRLGRGPLSIPDATRVMRQVCDAVAATHAAGILHRDLKPANVFLCDHPEAPYAKVLDFGISKLKPGATPAEGGDQPVGVTTTGQLLGTPRYLSPEQARGALELDERSDVYSAGVMLFEMIAGRPPFDGHNAFQLIWKHGNEPAPALSTHAEGIPPELDAVVARALMKTPEHRFESMAALRDALTLATETAALAPVDGAPSPPPAPAETLPSNTPLSDAEGPALLLQPQTHPSRRVRWAMLLGAAGTATALLWLGATARERSLDPRAAQPIASSPASLRARAAPPRPGAPAAAGTETGGAVDEPPAPDPAQPNPPDPARSPPEVPMTVLSLHVTPPDARVSVDGGEARDAREPCSVPSGREVTLTFSAPGYASEVRRLTPSAGEHLAVSLARRRGRSPRTPATSPIKSQF